MMADVRVTGHDLYNFVRDVLRVRSGESYSGDQIYYIPVNSYPTSFKPAYENMDALIAEFKEKVGEYLPEDFDYRSNIRHIVGTYFG